MSKQQTAVEWLYEQIPFEWSSSRAAFEALQQAKAMEKEQIIKAADHIMIYDNKGNYPTLGEIYYKETYES
jgi:hypothetical protein